MSVELTKLAAHDLDRLRRAQPVLFNKVTAKIRALAKEPGVGKPLVGPLKGIRSLRIGDYRILYEVARSTVVVLTVKHRRDVYK